MHAIILLASLAVTAALPTVHDQVADILGRDLLRPSRPTDEAAASRALAKIWLTSPTPTSVLGPSFQMAAAGLLPDGVDDSVDFEKYGGWYNNNPVEPQNPVYPQVEPDDVPYDLSESQLRNAIYIPEDFQYGADGAPQPIILVPGTGATGYSTFVGSFIPLMKATPIADPVWLNIPGYLLNDVQSNAEFVAYAINYISSISNGRKVAIAAWSQGNIDTQWAMKFWPSVRGKVTDHVALSPDYHGTILATYLASPGEPLPPSLIQQQYNSNFIQVLRLYDGDSAYVPTTTVFSGNLDEIVQPQSGRNASAYLLDVRNVGVTNNEVQVVCPNQNAGGFYTHEGIMYNPLAWALLQDALANDGPGRVERLDLDSVCSTYLTPGLTLRQFGFTELTLLAAGFNIVSYAYSTRTEPAIREQYLKTPLPLQMS